MLLSLRRYLVFPITIAVMSIAAMLLLIMMAHSLREVLSHMKGISSQVLLRMKKYPV